MNREEFDRAVRQALNTIPEDLWKEINNVQIVVEDEAPGQPHLYGLYHGIPLTKRSVWQGGALPDQITIYRKPITRDFGHNAAQLENQIRITVLHEVGHYFGIGEDRLHELGYA
jgi:predicted Zn-dependent protease with MMP-like domain